MQRTTLSFSRYPKYVYPKCSTIKHDLLISYKKNYLSESVKSRIIERKRSQSHLIDSAARVDISEHFLFIKHRNMGQVVFIVCSLELLNNSKYKQAKRNFHAFSVMHVTRKYLNVSIAEIRNLMECMQKAAVTAKTANTRI